MDCKFIFLVFFEELMYTAFWLKLPKLEGQSVKKEAFTNHRVLGFPFFLCSWFNMMSTSMQALGYEYQRFEYFQESLVVP